MVPGPLVNTGNLPAVVQTFFNRNLLRVALPKTVHMRVFARKPLPQKNSKTMIFRRLPLFGLATTPLVEGVTPAGGTVSHTEIQVSVQQWGDYRVVSDLVRATTDHPILRNISTRQGQQSAQTIDTLCANVAVAGTQVLRGNNEATRAALTTTTHKMSIPLLQRALRLLDQNNAPKYTEMIAASTKVSTFPIRAAYWLITHPDIVFTIDQLAGFISVEEYASSGPVLEAEIGAWKNMRILATTLATVYRGGGGTASGDVQSTGGLADVYISLLVGEDSLAAVPLEGMSMEQIVHTLGSAGAADPLDQRGTMGWKHTGARIITDDTTMVRLETTAGLLNP